MPNLTNFIAAVFSGIRFAEESLKADVSDVPPVKGQKLSTETNTGFEFAHDTDGDMDHFYVVVNYTVTVKRPEEGESLCSYFVKAFVKFDVLGFTGFSSWDEMPSETPVPYFSFAHYLVRERAEEHFRKAGFGGLKLTAPAQFKNLQLTQTGESREAFPPL